MSIRSMVGAKPRGYEIAEMVENGFITGVQTLQDWSKDDPDTWSDDILRLAGGGLKNIGIVAEAPLIKQALQLLDAPSHYGGKLGGRIAEAMGFDPRIGGAIGNIGGGLVTVGGAVKGGVRAYKGARTIQKTASSLLEGGISATAGTGINKATLTAAERGALLAKKSRLYKPNAANKAFINELERKTGEMHEWARTHKNRLDGYPGQRSIELPDGRVYRYEPSGQGGELKFSWKSHAAAKKASDKRNLSIQPDTDTLLNQFGGNQQIVDEYVGLNERIVRKVREGITAYNKANPDIPDVSLEHVFDVQHYGRLGAATRFSGKGADELGNLTVLGLKENARTGALARRIDSGDALVDLIKKDKFIDYNQTTADFIKHRVASKVKAWKKADWDLFTQTAIQNPEKNLHQILIEQITKKTEPQWDGIAKIAMRQMKEGNLPEARWRNANTQFTWAPKDLGGKGRGYIDIIKDATADDDIFALKRQFFKQIEDLPSGTEWTLEADTAQKYRMYKRMFRNDPRITPGGDTKLLKERGIDHFVLKIP